ncbi:uncharacterized protein LOC105661843 [Megachile rotundata]|uniref:uncharacterized protein LOC105661843 n=1 Tax=Megachile rotundata TaxID=143995 RepID=UPI000614A859|nr:PREDICTED: uncharacterized protein LOC105661843 [Megachile rotundata]
MEELLIEKVREREVLYNHGLPDYRDQHIRQAAWEEIGRELQIPGNKAKESWDKLRRCFCNARNRRRDDIKNGMSFKKKSSWKYEQQMSFIIPFLESRRTHGSLNESLALSNLNESQASSNLTAEPEDLSEGSEAEENTLRQLERGPIDLDTENERVQDNQAADDEAALNDESVEKYYDTTKVLRKKNQKLRIDNPAEHMVQILKESSALRKRQYEGKSTRPQTAKTTSLLETLDDTDMFFLSMSRMTKQLPKVEQSQIKLALSNLVLSAEVRCNQQSLSSILYPQYSFHQNLMQQQSFFSSPSPTPNNIQPVTSPSECSNKGGEYSIDPLHDVS